MAAIEELVGDRARDDKGRFVPATPAEPDKAEAAPTEPVQPQVTPPATPVEPPKVETQPVAPAPAAPVQPVESPETAAYKRAMRDEREKRQALEAQLRELQNPKTPVDPWNDLPGALKSQQEAFEDRLYAQACNISERLAKTQHPDYVEVRDVFLETARANPLLFQQMRAAEDPASFAYSEGLRIRELKDVGGDFTAYRSKIEKDTEARVRAELEAKYKATPAVPTSLNSDGSPPPVEVYQGPKPLNQILRNARS